MAVCLPNPQPFSNSLMFAMLLFLLSHNYRLLRRRRRGNLMPPGAINGESVSAVASTSLISSPWGDFIKTRSAISSPFRNNYGL